jgi:hypothetical protein
VPYNPMGDEELWAFLAVLAFQTAMKLRFAK